MSLAMGAKVSYNGIFGRGSDSVFQRAAKLARGAEDAARVAAMTANQTSLANIKRTRPDAPPRPGRNDQSIEATLRWGVTRDGGVGLNQSVLNERSPHWIIQEIGTDERAVVRSGSNPRPVGRPSAGANYIRTVKSQRGRRISSGLVFATGPSGQWVRPGAARNQQLYLRSQIKGVPATTTRSQPGIVIENEIKGQHFVQKGAEAGFLQYRQMVLEVARQQFRRSAR